MSYGVLWTKGREGWKKKKGTVAENFSSRVGFSIGLLTFFLRGWYVLLISRLKSRGEIGARDDARDELLK